MLYIALIRLYFFFWVDDNYIIHTFCLLTNYNVTQTAEAPANITEKDWQSG